MNGLASYLLDQPIRREEWQFADLRIDIPAGSFGSDAINPHTQYSNPVAVLESPDVVGFGASFTLGHGNRAVCEAAEYMVDRLHGVTLRELTERFGGANAALANPLQLRWLSPGAGLPVLAAGLLANTLLDAASKRAGLPAWLYLARLTSAELLELVDLRSLGTTLEQDVARDALERGRSRVDERANTLLDDGLPVYYTTWLGHTAEAVADQMLEQWQTRGIDHFKMKIGPDLQQGRRKLERVRSLVPEDMWISVDANQTLSLDEARGWLEYLSDEGFAWLEEPFAPDNVLLFRALVEHRRRSNLSCEIVTGENCPNPHVAASLMQAGIDRFQADPCRMLGMFDVVTVALLGNNFSCPITPHAGGSALDEMSPHIQLFNLARVQVDADIESSLTENVGFCSRYFAVPTAVRGGRAAAQRTPGLLVGLDESVATSLVSYSEGTTWLEL